MQTLRLSIEGMHCEGCVRRVTAALQSVKGVDVGFVQVGSAELTFDLDRTNLGEIETAVNRAGFSARVQEL
jgi:copper chaperone